MSLNAAQLKKLAAAMQQIEEGAAAAGAIFSFVGGGDADDAGDEKPARGRAAKPAAKPAGRAKKASAHTEDSVRDALTELVETKGADAVAEALAEVGAGKLSEVEEADYDALMDKVKELSEAEEAPAKSKRAPAKAKGPTFDDVKEKFDELKAADRAGSRAVLKELGIKAIDELDEAEATELKEALDAIEDALDA